MSALLGKATKLVFSTFRTFVGEGNMSRLEEQVPSGKKTEHSRKRRNGHNFDNMSSETASCEVCSAPAVIYKQYGAICCFSCRFSLFASIITLLLLPFFRAFFRRNFSRQFFCVIGEGTCKVDKITRNNCKKCRMERLHNILSLIISNFSVFSGVFSLG